MVLNQIFGLRIVLNFRRNKVTQYQTTKDVGEKTICTQAIRVNVAGTANLETLSS